MNRCLAAAPFLAVSLCVFCLCRRRLPCVLTLACAWHAEPDRKVDNPSAPAAEEPPADEGELPVPMPA